MKREAFLWPGIRLARPDTGPSSPERISPMGMEMGWDGFPRERGGENRARWGLNHRPAASETFPAHSDTASGSVQAGVAPSCSGFAQVQGPWRATHGVPRLPSSGSMRKLQGTSKPRRDSTSWWHLSPTLFLFLCHCSPSFPSEQSLIILMPQALCFVCSHCLRCPPPHLPQCPGSESAKTSSLVQYHVLLFFSAWSSPVRGVNAWSAGQYLGPAQVPHTVCSFIQHIFIDDLLCDGQ